METKVADARGQRKIQLAPNLLLMTEQQKRRRGAVEMGPTAATVAANVRRLRDDVRGWSTYELAGKLSKMGRPIAPSAVAKIERGERQVTVDDLMALAIALGVSPVTLLLPPNTRAQKDENGLPQQAVTEVTGAGEVGAGDAWRWAWCVDPLRIDPDLGDEEADRLVMDFLLNSRPIGMLSAEGDDRIASAALGVRRGRGADG